MRRNWLGLTLTTALAVVALCALVVSARYFFLVREAQSAQATYFRVTSTLNAAQALANDAIDYSRQHPALEPLLRQLEAKDRSVPDALRPVNPLPPLAPRR